MGEDHGAFYDVFPTVLGGGGPCACCMPSALLTFFIALFLIIQISCSILRSIIPFKIGKTVLTYFLYLLHGFVGLVAIFFGSLMQSKKFREFIFFQFALTIIASEKPMDIPRCEHFKNLHGRVLELGPGPGTNFRCWSDPSSHNITEWVGVEPNARFFDALIQEKAKRNVTFPTRTVWLRGEDVDIEPESFDFVIGSHVLCSVSDSHKVLQQISRALKPHTGEYVFFEHVAAAPNTWDYYLQMSVQPLLYFLGNGCQFKRIWEEIESKQTFPGFEVDLRHAMMPIELPFLAPHVLGRARKL
jgi:SAM-dependent methyltransferase